VGKDTEEQARNTYASRLARKENFLYRILTTHTKVKEQSVNLKTVLIHWQALWLPRI
jgi:hypothetical protein